MLKGQAFDVDIEFMGGTLIFIAIALIMFLEILLPLMVVNYNVMSSEDDVRSVLLANLVRWRMSERIGNGRGDISRPELLALHDRGTEELGLDIDSFVFSDINSYQPFTIKAKGGETLRNIYFSLISPYLAVTDDSINVMDSGEEYIVHIYKTSAGGSNMMMDIYREAACVQNADANERGSYRAIDCEDIPEQGLVQNGVKAHLRGIASNMIENGDDIVAWVKPDNVIEAGDLVIPGTELGSTQDCTDSASHPFLCIRLAGDYVLPARMNVKLGEDAVTLTKTVEDEAI